MSTTTQSLENPCPLTDPATHAEELVPESPSVDTPSQRVMSTTMQSLENPGALIDPATHTEESMMGSSAIDRASQKSMSTTTHLFMNPCPLNDPTTHTEELSNPSLTLQVVTFTAAGMHKHTNHVHYTVGQTEHSAIRECDLTVPADQFVMTILWRTNTTESISVSRNSGSTTASTMNQSDRTVITFQVPTLAQGTTTWEVTNGDPGFDLTVKVRRKA